MKNKIYQLRIKKRLSQVELSKKTGIAQPHISAIENGNRIMGLKVMKKFAAAFNIPLMEILKNE